MALSSPRRIIIDPRQEQRDRMDTLLHEGLHIALPDLTEDDVGRVAGMLCNLLWKDRYRRVER